MNNTKVEIVKPNKFVSNLKDSKKISNKPLRYIPVCFDTLWNTKIVVNYYKSYEKDINLLGPVMKQIVKGLIKDIKRGYIYVDPPGKNSDTHIIYSKSTEERLIYNKKVNESMDRLTYSIEKLDDMLYITILSCLGHKTGKGQEKNYSE